MKRKVDTRVSFFGLFHAQEVFDLDHVVFFEGNLYERIVSREIKYRYRVLLNSDDYDYVTDRNLKRRLDRVFKKEGV